MKKNCRFILSILLAGLLLLTFSGISYAATITNTFEATITVRYANNNPVSNVKVQMVVTAYYSRLYFYKGHITSGYTNSSGVANLSYQLQGPDELQTYWVILRPFSSNHLCLEGSDVEFQGGDITQSCTLQFSHTFKVKNCSSAIPPYSPSFWNDSSQIRLNNNCYNYSNNKRTDTYAQPGRYAGAQPTSMTVDKVANASVADGLIRVGKYGFLRKLPGYETCPSNWDLVALFVWPNYDYHWYRRDSNGKWSHKPGGTNATNLDLSSQIINDPYYANRGDYTDYGGCFCICSSSTQGGGMSNIYSITPNNGGLKSNSPEIKQNGLRVTIDIFSGVPNPTLFISTSNREEGITDMATIEIIDYWLSTSSREEVKSRVKKVSRPILGYRGIVIEKIGKVDFPYDKIIAYGEHLEVAGTNIYGIKEGSILIDYGYNLEDFIIKLALQKGILSEDLVANIIKHRVTGK